MRRSLGILMFALAACSTGSNTTAVGTESVVDGGTAPQEGPCQRDDDCGAGLVCVACEGGASCVPGCRVDAQCPSGEVCLGPVACKTCPCPPGWCQLDPCRDADGDGFAAATAGTCPGKRVGDCDDSRPLSHPGARERCWNGVDDDCNGLTDRSDPGCQTCGADVTLCNEATDCGLGTAFCDRGCCTACPAVTQPTCATEECLFPTGVDPETGCQQPPACGPCTSCSATGVVCDTAGISWASACVAAERGATVAHAGPCLWAEGLACDDAPAGTTFSCASELYCRDTHSDGGVARRCTEVGACLVDDDCPAGETLSSSCDAGAVRFHCRAHQCEGSCGL